MTKDVWVYVNNRRLIGRLGKNRSGVGVVCRVNMRVEGWSRVGGSMGSWVGRVGNWIGRIGIVSWEGIGSIR